MLATPWCAHIHLIAIKTNPQFAKPHMYYYYKCFDANLPHIEVNKNLSYAKWTLCPAKPKTVSHITHLMKREMCFIILICSSLFFSLCWQWAKIFGMLTIMLCVRVICTSSKSRLLHTLLFFFFFNEWLFFFVSRSLLQIISFVIVYFFKPNHLVEVYQSSFYVFRSHYEKGKKIGIGIDLSELLVKRVVELQMDCWVREFIDSAHYFSSFRSCSLWSFQFWAIK